MASMTDCIQLKTEIEFHFSHHSLKELLKRTTQNIDEKLWSRILKFNVDTSCLRGQDYELATPLAELKNPRLVYSVMLHYLGRSIFCSKKVHDRFKQLLKKRINESCEELKIIVKNDSHTIEEIMAPYNQLATDFQRWSNETITWNEYVNELSLRENIMIRLKEKCSKYDLSESSDFLVDLMANLHLDNYFFKSLKNAHGNKEYMFVSERSAIWTMPLKVEVKVDQKRTIQSTRLDIVNRKTKLKHVKLDYKDLENELDPYMHGGHIRSVIGNENDELDFYLKKHPGRQTIIELVFLMFGTEVQKNPAVLIYNMMVIDLIDGDKACQREIFNSGDPEHSKEKGGGGILPCSFEGNATAARYLNIYYSYIFNHWYSYDINEENDEKIMETLMNPASEYNTKRDFKIRFEEMLQREYDMINKWINFKKERDRKARNLKNIHELWYYIMTKTTQWYEPFKIVLSDPKK